MKSIFTLLIGLLLVFSINAESLNSVIDIGENVTIELSEHENVNDFTINETIQFKSLEFQCNEFSYDQVILKPYVFIASDAFKNRIVDVGKNYNDIKNYTYTNLLRTQYRNLSLLEIVNARSRLICKTLNLLY